MGAVEVDDQSDQRYRVKWDDGTESWLYPKDVGSGMLVDVLVDFGGDVGQVRLLKEHLDAVSCASLTPLQNTVKKARLTRVEVVVLVLYTGPMFLLYNGILRGFGNCGEVKIGIEFGSEAFWTHIQSVTVAARVAKSKNKFASTIHVLASAIKKLQSISDDAQGTTLYRGLGGLDVHDFVKS